MPCLPTAPCSTLLFPFRLQVGRRAVQGRRPARFGAGKRLPAPPRHGAGLVWVRCCWCRGRALSAVPAERSLPGHSPTHRPCSFLLQPSSPRRPQLPWEDVQLGLLTSDVVAPQHHPAFRAAWRACSPATALKHLDVDAPRLFWGLHAQDASGAAAAAAGCRMAAQGDGWRAGALEARWRHQLTRSPSSRLPLAQACGTRSRCSARRATSCPEITLDGSSGGTACRRWSTSELRLQRGRRRGCHRAGIYSAAS